VEVVEVSRNVEGGEALIRALTKAIDKAVGLGPGSTLVVGLPLNMDGSEGPAAAQTRTFAQRLAERTGQILAFQDERLTSAAADWSMARSGLTRGEKKARRDALAACEILRDFLASQRREPGPSPDVEHLEDAGPKPRDEEP
jgi:putative transcription antitermination factor YqgF